MAEVQSWWRGEEGTLVVSAETAAVFTTQWGNPAANVQILDAAAIEDRLWQRDGARAIVPFEQLTPRIKPLHIDGNSLFSRSFDVASYPLAVTIGANGDIGAVSALRDGLAQPLTNSSACKADHGCYDRCHRAGACHCIWHGAERYFVAG